MRAVIIIIRFVQLLALVPVGIGLGNALTFFVLLNGLAQGQPWDYAEFAKRLVAFSSPTGLGVGLILGLELLLRRGRGVEERALRFPEQPWLWEPMWAERRIRLSNRTSLAICVSALAAFAFVLAPVGLWMASQKAATPVYTFLGASGHLPAWNFSKYVIGRDGRVRAFFPSEVTPQDPALRRAIADALAAK